jgi:hypothetical protein
LKADLYWAEPDIVVGVSEVVTANHLLSKFDVVKFDAHYSYHKSLPLFATFFNFLFFVSKSCEIPSLPADNFNLAVLQYKLLSNASLLFICSILQKFYEEYTCTAKH